MEFEEKKTRLYAVLDALVRKNTAVAFSGGVDSSLILKITTEQAKKYGTKVLAVTAATELHPQSDLTEAKKVAEEIGCEHAVIAIDEMKDAGITDNPVNRCYLCKKHIFNEIMALGNEREIDVFIEGSNLDDTKVYRPGLQAIKELGVNSPLILAEFTKEDVRRLAAELNISSASRPSAPCLATRFPYGTRLTREDMVKVEGAEEFLRSLGIKNVRVRVHGDLARIEVDSDNLLIFVEKRDQVVQRLKASGYNYVTLDLQGFRSGSMDELLNK